MSIILFNLSKLFKASIIQSNLSELFNDSLLSKETGIIFWRH